MLREIKMKRISSVYKICVCAVTKHKHTMQMKMMHTQLTIIMKVSNMLDHCTTACNTLLTTTEFEPPNKHHTINKDKPYNCVPVRTS